MMASAPRTTRNLFIASLALLIVSLVVSVTNVLTVVSAPLQVTVPSKIGYEGFLTDGSGNPLADGAYDLTFKLYSVASGGAAIATEVLNDTPVTDGLYVVVLQTLTASQFDGDRWLGLTVDAGAEISPTTRITSVPFALNAQTAQNADAVAWMGVSGKPAGFSDGVDNDTLGGLGCSTNQIAKWNGSAWTCQADSGVTGTGASGQVTTWNSTGTVNGSSGLTFVSNNLTVTGGVNAGAATGAAAGDLAYSGGLRSYENGTLHTGYAVVLLNTPLKNSALGPSANLNIGTYVIDIDSTTVVNGSIYGFSGPPGVRIVLVRFSLAWPAASSSNYASVRATGSASVHALVRAQVAGQVFDEQAWVPVDSNGQFDLVVTGANAVNAALEIVGYGL